MAVNLSSLRFVFAVIVLILAIVLAMMGKLPVMLAVLFCLLAVGLMV